MHKPIRGLRYRGRYRLAGQETWKEGSVRSIAEISADEARL